MLRFRDLYEEYEQDVHRFALWLSGNVHDADDITSETFVRAWTRRTAFRTETLKAYLLKIARNVYLHQVRNGNRLVPLDDAYPDLAPSPEDVVASRLELGRVRSFLQRVSEPDRAAFTLRVQHELPYAEIARVLGVSVVAARVKVHRVRKRLIAAFYLGDGERR